MVYDGSGPAGYLFYSIDDRTLMASEMAWSSEAGQRGLYAYMAGHLGSVDRCRWYEPMDDRSYLFWADGAEHTYIRNRTFPYMMARVTDPAAAFTGAAAAAEGTVSFRLDDGFLPELSGAYTLRTENGVIRAEAGARHPSASPRPARCISSSACFRRRTCSAAAKRSGWQRRWKRGTIRSVSSGRISRRWLTGSANGTENLLLREDFSLFRECV